MLGRRSPDQGLDQFGLVRGLRAQGPHLEQRLVERKIGGDHAVRGIVAAALDFLVEGPGQAGHAIQIGLGVTLRLDPVLVLQQVGHGLIGAGELAQLIGKARRLRAVETPVGAGLDVQAIADGVIVDQVVAIERRAWDALQFVELAAVGPFERLPSGQGPVVEMVDGVGVNPAIQAEDRRGLRRQGQLLVDNTVEGACKGDRSAASRRGGDHGGGGRCGGGGQEELAAIEHCGCLSRTERPGLKPAPRLLLEPN
jgi:hypothetical protein